MIRRVQTVVPFVVAFVLVQALLGHVWTDTLWLTSFATFLVAILLEAVPFVLIGSIVSGTIEVFVSREAIARRVPRNRVLAVLLFGGLGVLFPICECGVVPVIRRLLRKGVPLSCGVTYLLAAPIVQPIVFVSTLVAFNGSWEVAALRTVGGYLVAVLVGISSIFVLDSRIGESTGFTPVSAESQPERAVPVCSMAGHLVGRGEGTHSPPRPSVLVSEDNEGLLVSGHESCLSVSPCVPLSRKVRQVLRNAIGDFVGTGTYLIFGAFLAAAMQTFVSQDALARIGHGPLLGPLTMMATAFTLSLCSTADAFVAAAFSQFSIPARMAFLVMGPMVDIKLVAMYNGFLPRRASVFIFGMAALLAFLFALLLQSGGFGK